MIIKKLRKVLSLVIAFGLIANSTSSLNAFSKNDLEPININEKQIPVVNNLNNKKLNKNSGEIQSTPVLNDWLSTKTSKVDNELIHYIDGLSFENYDKGDHNSTGLGNVMLNASGYDRYDKAQQLEKVVVPHIDIEADYQESGEKTAGIRVVLAGWTTNFDFEIPKRYMKTSDQDSVSETETINTKLEESDEIKGEVVDGDADIVFTREEILDAMKKEMIANGKEVPTNDEDIKMPNEYIIYFMPVNDRGEQIYYRGINKLEQNKPIEFHYTTKDKPIYSDWAHQRFDVYFDWYTTFTNDRTESKTTQKEPYYETSDITITPDKTKDLKPGDVVNLNINIKNTTNHIINKFLTAGYDEVRSDGGKKGFEEFRVTDENGSYIILQPGDEVNYSRSYTIPVGYKGDSIDLNPYIYGVMGEYDYAKSKGSLYFVPDEKDYNDTVTLYMKNSSSGGGGGGAVVDPPTDPVNPPAPGKTVILASGEKYTDVLTATVLGNEKDAPILLSKKDSIDNKTIDEIDRLNPVEIIISGGPDSVSDKALSQLSEYKVTRISGATRYETASKIGDEVRAITGNKTGAMLVDGTNFPDVITMSTLASQKRVPIILTEPSKLTGSTKNTINTWGVNDITIGGSYNSVSQAVEDNLGVSKVSRLGGVNRYATAELIANEVRKNGSKTDMILVDGTKFPDGLTVNSLASNFKAPIMLTEPDTLNSITANNIGIWSIKNILIGGGYNSVSKSIEDNLNATKKERVAGEDRYETAVKISQRLSDGNIAIGDK